MSSDTTDTLKVGDKAPAFSLSVANQPVTASLSGVLKRGPAIVEFLRGTW
jgi:peroxiredoxin